MQLYRLYRPYEEAIFSAKRTSAWRDSLKKTRKRQGREEPTGHDRKPNFALRPCAKFLPRPLDTTSASCFRNEISKSTTSSRLPEGGYWLVMWTRNWPIIAHGSHTICTAHRGPSRPRRPIKEPLLQALHHRAVTLLSITARPLLLVICGLQFAACSSVRSLYSALFCFFLFLLLRLSSSSTSSGCSPHDACDHEASLHHWPAAYLMPGAAFIAFVAIAFRLCLDLCMVFSVSLPSVTETSSAGHRPGHL